MIFTFTNANCTFDTDKIATFECFDLGHGRCDILIDGQPIPEKIHYNDGQKMLEAIREEKNYHQVVSNILVNVDHVSAAYVSGYSFCVQHSNGILEVDEVPSLRATTMFDALQQRLKADREAASNKGSYNAASAATAKSTAKTQTGVASPDTIEGAKKSIDDMIGCDRAKREMSENLAYVMLEQAKEAMGFDVSEGGISRHMAYLGNPGTGKTTFARKVAALYHAAGIIAENKVIEVTRKDLVGAHVGKTGEKTAEVIEKAQGGVLFIDEAYDLVRTKGDNDFGQEVINELVSAMENKRNDFVVICAGYPDEIEKFLDYNPGLKSRFSSLVTFEDYSAPELNQIMHQMYDKQKIKITSEAESEAMRLIEASKKTEGKSFANARTVRNLVEQSQKALATRLVAEGKLPLAAGATVDADLLTVTKADLANVSLGVTRKQAVEVEAPRNVVGFKTAAKTAVAVG